MPLARIITRHHSDAQLLAERLRAQGYMVETVTPEQIHISPADLEISLEKCTPQEALARAAELAQQVGAEEIYVGEDVVTDSAMEPIPESVQDSTPPLREKQSRLLQWWSEHFQRTERKALSSLEREAEPEVFAGKSARQPEAIAEEQHPLAAGDQDATADGHPQPFVIGEKGGATQVISKEEQHPLAAGDQPVIAEQQVHPFAFGEKSGATRERSKEDDEEEEERARQAAEMRDRLLREAEERRLAEEAEAQYRAKMEAAARAGEEKRRAEAALAAPSPSLPARLTHAVPVARPRRRGLRQREREWRLAVAIAAVFAVLLAVGWRAVTSAQPASPLSNSQLNKASEIQQQVPFGPATIPAKPAPKVSVEANVPVPRLPAATAPPQKKPSAAVQKRSRKRPAASADDVVVRHFAAPSPIKADRQTNANLKRYSDAQ